MTARILRAASLLLIGVAALALAACSSTSSTKRRKAKGDASNYNMQLGMAYLNQGDLGLAKEKLDRADREYRTWVRNGLRKRTLIGWIVEDNQGRIGGSGCLWLQPIQPRPGIRTYVQPYLLSMFTEPRFRGKGVATKIVDEAKRWSRKRGFPQLVLNASKMGRGVYSGRGFKRSWEMRARLGRRR